ncbi:hypothetical protein BJ912DRAFT_469141 [Pholiota molesta]|nr:hypothetical protein BJ912DRAFT_469141 [Pholiota molesta]
MLWAWACGGRMCAGVEQEVWVADRPRDLLHVTFLTDALIVYTPLLQLAGLLFSQATLIKNTIDSVTYPVYQIGVPRHCAGQLKFSDPTTSHQRSAASYRAKPRRIRLARCTLATYPLCPEFLEFQGTRVDGRWSMGVREDRRRQIESAASNPNPTPSPSVNSTQRSTPA